MKKVEAQREDVVWKDYIFYVNEKIADGIIDIILFNLNKLYDSLYPEFTKKDNPIEPLLEIDIKIVEKNLRFNLEFKSVGDEQSIFGLID